MDLWRLNIFRNVIECKSFSKAAEAIHLSQPTVSSHIKDLENHFECKLIDRLEKKAVPTKAGELLYSYAGKLLTLFDETEAAMADFHGIMRGRLVIGGSTIPAGYILPPVIGRYINTYPDVKISLVVDDTKKIIKKILSGKIELGIVGAKVRDKRLDQRKLIEEEMRVIVPCNHKFANFNNIDIKTLINEPFIIRESGSGTLMSIQDNLSKKGIDSTGLNIVAEMGSTESVIQGIKNKVGISILSPVAVSEELSAGTLKALSIKGLNLKRKFYFTRHKGRSESPLCKSFNIFIEKDIEHFVKKM